MTIHPIRYRDFEAGLLRFGLRRASFGELVSGLALAESLTGQRLATAEALTWIDTLTGCTNWVTGDPVDGVFLPVPLSPEGVAALFDGSFNPGWPALAHICAENEPCGGVYMGVYAGATKTARRAIMMATATLRVEIFGPVPCFARAATEDGARSMTSLGFRPVEGGLKDLWMMPPVAGATEERAA